MIVARDAGANARDRVLPLARAVGVPWTECASAVSLGQALGRGRTVVAGIEEPRLAARVLELLGPGAGEDAADVDGRLERSEGDVTPRRA